MTACPTCSSTALAHSWRTDMAKLRWIDEWTCLKCKARWTEVSNPAQRDYARR